MRITGRKALMSKNSFKKLINKGAAFILFCEQVLLHSTRFNCDQSLTIDHNAKVFGPRSQNLAKSICCLYYRKYTY